jgi:hypothetical protein
MSNSTERDWRYGVKPRNVALKQEAIPQSPAKKPSGYCKRLKGGHVFELADVTVYNQYGYPQGYQGPVFVMGFTHYKEYRCTGCDKKKMDRVEFTLDRPVEKERLAS